MFYFQESDWSEESIREFATFCENKTLNLVVSHISLFIDSKCFNCDILKVPHAMARW